MLFHTEPHPSITSQHAPARWKVRIHARRGTYVQYAGAYCLVAGYPIGRIHAVTNEKAVATDELFQSYGLSQADQHLDCDLLQLAS